MIDFHTHFLSGIDDGSRSIEESQAILDLEGEAGIHKVVASPHYYPNQKLEEFLAKRDEAYINIEPYLEARGIQVKRGAEVLLSVDTCSLEGIEALCIEGTRYILIELPYSRWSDWVYTSVEKLIYAKGLCPILAHVERYDEVYNNPNRLLPFLEMGCLLQVNTSSLHVHSSRYKLTCKLVKHGFIHLLGSDVHRSGGFHPVSVGYDTLRGMIGVEAVEEMLERGKHVYQGEKVTLNGYKPFKRLLGKWY